MVQVREGHEACDEAGETGPVCLYVARPFSPIAGVSWGISTASRFPPPR